MDPELAELIRKLKTDKVLKMDEIRQQNLLLNAQFQELNQLKKRFEDYWLDAKLKHILSKKDCETSEKIYSLFERESRKIDQLDRLLDVKLFQIDESIKRAKDKLSQFSSLDPKLLDDYRKIKDDIECQEEIIKISQNNALPSTGELSFL